MMIARWGRLCVLVCLFLLAACGQATPEPLPTLVDLATETPTSEPATPTNTPEPSPTAGRLPRAVALDPAEQAYVRVVHAAPDTPTIDVFIELLGIAFDLEFSRFTDPSGITAGDYELRVVPSGSPANTPALVTSPFSIQGGQTLVVLVTGTPDALAVSIFNESNRALSSQESRINVVHAVPRGADFILQRDGINLTSNLSFGQSSPELILTSGQTSLRFQSGTTTLLDFPVELRGRRNYTYILVGRPDDLTTLSVIEFETTAPGLTGVRVINASEQIGPIDVYVGERLIAGQLTYLSGSLEEMIESNTYPVRVFAAGSDRNAVQPLLTTDLFANPDEQVSLIIVGEPSNLRLTTYVANTEPTEFNEARVAFLNTLETVSRATLETDGGYGLDLFYGQTSDELTLPAGTVSFYWTDSTGQNLESAVDVFLEPGQTYLYLFAARGTEPPSIFNLFVGANPDTTTGTDPFAEATPSLPTRVLLVNAMPTTPFTDFFMDDGLMAPALNYTQASPLIIIPDGMHTFTVRDPEANILLSRDERNYEIAVDYTIYAYGAPTTAYGLLVVPHRDVTLDPLRASIRLVNLSQDANTSLGLGYSAAAPNVFQPGAEEGYRQTLPFGIETVIRNIESGFYSPPEFVPPGDYNIRILDSRQTALAFTIQEVTLLAGRHYDIIAIQDSATPQVTGFIAPLPEF